jgi:UDP-N-acetylglucosamine 2-epimerase (non-hydrolysing)
MAPVIAELGRFPEAFEPLIVTTSQHREMLSQALGAFHLSPDHDLGLTHANQTLAEFTAHAVIALTQCFADLRPDLLLVQGDTSTVVSAALAAFYQGIAIGHIEAGLRSGDMRRPFPEEANRRIASVAADLHFCPTETARGHLLHEGVNDQDIYVTGNTVVDALQSVPRHATFDESRLAAIPWDRRRVLLATVHRRENLGENLRHICAALRHVADARPDVQVIIPVHLNPRVREVVFEELREHPAFSLFDPLSYPDLLEVMRRSTLVLTDSGGIQEEAPACQKPVLILRTVTERPEVIDSGFGRLVGTDPAEVAGATLALLDDPAALAAMTGGANPFGDGRASERIVTILLDRLRSGRRYATPEPKPVAVQAARRGAA